MDHMIPSSDSVDMSFQRLDPPKTQAEIDAFAEAVRAESDHPAHFDQATMSAEHTAAMNLVSRADATHVAVNHGSWFDPSTWAGGEIPGEDARVLIPKGIEVSYDGSSDANLFTVRVDGHLTFATDVSSKMRLDTMVTSPTGWLTVGTEDNPVQADVQVEVLFTNRGDIDVSWDPMLLSRGLIAHGKTTMHGETTESHDKVLVDPMSGDTAITLADLPDGWEVGDTLVIAGTKFDGYKWGFDSETATWKTIWHETEDEVRTISSIEVTADGTVIHFDQALVHDHATPRDDLKTSVANYTREIVFATEDPDNAAVHQRAHVMFMHSDDVDARYVEFRELGRTDKSERALDVEDVTEVAADTNLKGRYAVHLHMTGLEDIDDPSILVGNAVYGSPGFGFVHHQSNAILDNNATYNVFGAGFIAESGNEIGSWTNNIAIGAHGINAGVKDAADVKAFDLGRTGDGFWFQGRMVESSGNIAASVNHGFVYMHRGSIANKFDAETHDFPELFTSSEAVPPDDAPIRDFRDNEAFAVGDGLHVVKANPNQGHDLHTHLERFTAWEAKRGVHLEYTSHYTLEDFDLVGKTKSQFSGSTVGISFGNNTSDMTIVGGNIDGFDKGGIDLYKNFTNKELTSDLHAYQIVGTSFGEGQTPFVNYDPTLDTVVEERPAEVTPELILDAPLTYKEGLDPAGRKVIVSGTKIDSLGEARFPAGTDSVVFDLQDVVHILETDGYFTTPEGKNVFIVEVLITDRMTGEVVKQGHLVEVDDNVPLGYQHSAYKNAVYSGEIDPESLAPVTAADQADTMAGTDVTIDVLTNDAGDPELGGTTQPDNGKVFVNQDGTLTYRPDAGFTGTDMFEYWATDGFGNFTKEEVTVTVRMPDPMTETMSSGMHGAVAAALGLDNPTLAINVSAVNDHTPGMQFLDIMKMARPWIGHETGRWGGMSNEELVEGGYLDANGWPTEIPEGVEKIGTLWQWSGNADALAHGAGTYVLNYDGEGEIVVRGGVKILSTDDGQIRFEATGSNIYLEILETDPSGSGDYLRDITIVKEEHVPLVEAGAVFNPDWIETISDVREIRFMAWQGTNSKSSDVEWEDRDTPDAAGSSDVPVEYMVQLANEIGADPWFCMPHTASDEYIRTFAEYVRDNLDPALTAKVEYSNETWNKAFPAYGWAKAQAEAEWGTDEPIKVNHYLAKKATETALIWQEVFADEPEGRLVNVLGAQGSIVRLAQNMLNPTQWQQNEPDTYVDPASVFDSIAVATYYGGKFISNAEYRDALIAVLEDPEQDAFAYVSEKLLDPEFMGSIYERIAYQEAHKALADEYGLDLLAYEGGQHIQHAFSVKGLTQEHINKLTDFLSEFIRSPHMEEVTKANWEAWKEVGDGPYMQFGDITKPSKWGFWGYRESLDTITPLGETLMELNATETPWWDGAEGGVHYQQGITAIGTEADDLLIGTVQEDYLLGGNGDDVLHGGAGNDGLHGGSGIDRALFSGHADDYSIKAEGAGYRMTGLDGSDMLVEIEEIAFADGEVISLDDFLAAQVTGPSIYTVDDPDGKGMTIGSLNPWSVIGKAAGAVVGGEAAFSVYERGASAEIAGQIVVANYCSLNDATTGKGEARLTEDPMDTFNALAALAKGYDEYHGGSGNDRMMGRDEDNVFRGGGGRDYIYGNAGDDLLDGGDGADTIIGGKGNDILIGGAGADTFLFSKGDGWNKILDLEEVDRLNLKGFFENGETIQDTVTVGDDHLLISNGIDEIRLGGLGEEDLLWVSGICVV